MSLSRPRRPSGRLPAALAILAVALGITAEVRALGERSPSETGPPVVDVSPVPLDPGDAGRKTVGRLRYLGGLWLRSQDPRFGGLSDLRLSADGGTLWAVSDCGSGFVARLHYDLDGDLASLSDARIVPLADAAGQPLGHDDIDAESLMRVGTDELDVGFEGRPCIRGYGLDFAGPARSVGAPDGLDECGGNSGLELMSDAGDDRRLLICEGRKNASRTVPAWIGNGDSWQAREYPLKFDGGWAGEPFRPTSATRLPNGDVLVLERRFPPLAARVLRLSREQLDGTALLEGSELARIEAPLTLDNFEGIDALRDARGRTLVYLVSDDNNCAKSPNARRVSPQRTLLLQFVLEE